MGSTQCFHQVLLPVLTNSAKKEVLDRGTPFGKPVMPVYFMVSMISKFKEAEAGYLRLDIKDGPRDHFLRQF
jgi:hypothetical protein